MPWRAAAIRWRAIARFLVAGGDSTAGNGGRESVGSALASLARSLRRIRPEPVRRKAASSPLGPLSLVSDMPWQRFFFYLLGKLPCSALAC